MCRCFYFLYITGPGFPGVKLLFLYLKVESFAIFVCMLIWVYFSAGGFQINDYVYVFKF